MFWAVYRGDVSESARRLISQHRATIVNCDGADELLQDVTERIQRLDEVAARRGRPTLLRNYAFMPEQTVAPQGWAVLPLLQLRVAAVIGPATLDQCGLLRPEHRAMLTDALQFEAITNRVRLLAGWPPATAVPEAELDGQTTIAATVPGNWSDSPGALQSTEHASYRIGGDGTSGVSAMVTIRFPSHGNQSGGVLVLFDVGLSLAASIRLADAAHVFREGLVFTTSSVQTALAGLIPAGAEVFQAEVHLLAAPTDGQGHPRPNSLLARVDLSSLGQPTRDIGPSMGSAVRLSAPLAEREAAEVAADCVEYMALAHGYLNPTNGITLLRQELRASVT